MKPNLVFLCMSLFASLAHGMILVQLAAPEPSNEEIVDGVLRVKLVSSVPGNSQVRSAVKSSVSSKPFASKPFESKLKKPDPLSQKAYSSAQNSGPVDQNAKATEGVEGSEDPNNVYGESDLDEGPRLLIKPNPIYPAELATLGMDGEVELSILVDREGSVRETSVIKTSHELFTEEALREVKKFRFSEPRLNSKSVLVRLRWILHFDLPE